MFVRVVWCDLLARWSESAGLDPVRFKPLRPESVNRIAVAIFLKPRDAKSRQSMLADQSIPGQELFPTQAIAFAGIFKREHPCRTADTTSALRLETQRFVSGGGKSSMVMGPPDGPIITVGLVRSLCAPSDLAIMPPPGRFTYHLSHPNLPSACYQLVKLSASRSRWISCILPLLLKVWLTSAPGRRRRWLTGSSGRTVASKHHDAGESPPDGSQNGRADSPLLFGAAQPTIQGGQVAAIAIGEIAVGDVLFELFQMQARLSR